METKERIADDMILGGPAIAEELGITEDQLHNWIKNGRIPVGRIGRSLIARRSELQRAIAKLTSERPR